MQPGTRSLTLLLIILLLFHGSRAIAESRDQDESGTINLSPLLLVPESVFLTDHCDEAREWFDEGVLLSDNSNREIYFYQRAIDLCPGFIAAHNRLAEVYKNQGKYILSIDEFKQARIQAFSSDRFASISGSKALFLESVISLGEIYRIQGKYKLAAEEFSKALQIDPASPAAQNQLQYVYKRMHRYDDALSSHNRLLDNAIFTRIPGMTLPRNTFTFDLQYRTWSQTAPIAPFTVESWRVISQFIFSPTIPDELKLLLFTEELIPERNADNPVGPLDEFIQGFLVFDERKATVNVGALSMRYGITNSLTIGVVPKFFARSVDIEFNDFNSINELDKQTVYGIGDTELFLKYHIWSKRHQHISIYSRFTLPTGDVMEVVGEEPLITRQNFPTGEGTFITENWEFKRYIPFGSESYDITPGLAFTLGLDPVILLTNMQYRFTDGEQIGDEFRLNCAAIYPMNRIINITMEMNYRWAGNVKRVQNITFFKIRPSSLNLNPGTPAGPVNGDIEFTELGGHSLFLSPGFQVNVTERTKLEFGMQIPVIRQTDGWMENIIYHLGVTFVTF